MSWLFFNKLNCTPLSKTEGGAPQIDEDFLDSVKHIKFVQDLIDSKKLKKLLSTYVEGFIERFHNGKIYPSFLQFGTTSGRYSCTNPNLQNLVSIKDEESGVSPLVLKYANQIRKGIAVTSQYQIVNADFSQLEVVCFSIASGETIIQDMFRNNLDFYSGVAIKVWKIPNVSADKKAPNFLKKINPTARQNSKQFALGIPYGAAAHRISEMLKISKQEAQHIIDDYLESFPQLAQWMEEQKQQVITQGFVKNMFGRIRHLEKAKNLHEWYGEKLLDWKWADKNGLSDERRTLKNLINLSRNYPIQSLAACIVNRSAIEIMKTIDKEDIKAYPILQVHDELTFVCTIEHSQRLKEIMKHCMENTVKLPVALTAEPLIADNWGDAK